MQGERVRVVGLCGADCTYNGQNGIIVEWSNDRGKVRIETGYRGVGNIVHVQQMNLSTCSQIVDMMCGIQSARSSASVPTSGARPSGPPSGPPGSVGGAMHMPAAAPAPLLSLSAGSSGKDPYADLFGGHYVDAEQQQLRQAIQMSLAEPEAAAGRQPSPHATPAAMARAPPARHEAAAAEAAAADARNEPPAKKPKIKAQQPTGAMPQRPGTRKALAVGINTYSTMPLRCCINDASAVHDALQRMGYASTLVTDCDIATLLHAKRTFVDSLQQNDIAFFYFAGHGTEASVRQAGKHCTSNWLLARDVPKADSDLPRYALDAHNLLADMEARGTLFNALVLDCCRDNPLPDGTRSLGSSGGPFNGLASMDPRGSLVAFACAPGAKSIELPREPHGIYTHHLLKHLETPGLEINALFIRIGNAVEQATQHLPQPQRPYVNHCLRCETASLFPNPSPIRQDVTGVGIGGDGGGGVGNSAQPARATGATMHA